MTSEFDYMSVWLLYLGAGAAFYWVFHRYTSTASPSWWMYSLRGMYFALALTPAYANVQGESLAPALMVATLDLITSGPDAFSRALVPLLLSIFAGIVISSVIFVYKKRLSQAHK